MPDIKSLDAGFAYLRDILICAVCKTTLAQPCALSCGCLAYVLSLSLLHGVILTCFGSRCRDCASEIGNAQRHLNDCKGKAPHAQATAPIGVLSNLLDVISTPKKSGDGATKPDTLSEKKRGKKRAAEEPDDTSNVSGLARKRPRYDEEPITS